MKYHDISPSLRIFFGAREGLRRLGFTADEMRCVTVIDQVDGMRHTCCVLEAQGKSFVFDCGLAEKTSKEMQEEYNRVGAAINAGSLSDADLRLMWETCGFMVNPLRTLTALLGKGFRFPVTNRHLS